MFDMVFLITFMGFGVGYEGMYGDKMYFGTYTPTREYGWVVEDGELYLDSVLEKTFVQY